MDNSEATERFNDVSFEWDLKPSTIAVTNAMSEAIKNTEWYSGCKREGQQLRAMDFGCGTGLLTQKILDPDVFDTVFSSFGPGRGTVDPDEVDPMSSSTGPSRSPPTSESHSHFTETQFQTVNKS